jgi:hypothetical protein
VLDVTAARRKPLLGGIERQPHQERLTLLADARRAGLVVFLPPGVQFAAPDQELALVLQPALQRRPSLEQDFVRDLRGGLAVLLAGDDDRDQVPVQQI